MNRIKKSSIIFFILPSDVRYRVKYFLTSNEWSKLIKFNKRDSNQSLTTSLYDVKKFINQMKALSQIKTTFPLRKLYFFSFLIFAIISLIFKQYTVSIYLFLYLIIGHICIRNKSTRYWEIQFFKVKLEEKFIIMAIIVYIFLILLLGYYITESYSRFDWAYKPTIFFVFQASLFGPIFEEIFFRGYIFELVSMGLKDQYRREYAGIWVSSFLFALIHLNYANIDSLIGDLSVFFIAGLALGFLKWYTRSLLYCSITHISFNLTMIFL